MTEHSTPNGCDLRSDASLVLGMPAPDDQVEANLLSSTDGFGEDDKPYTVGKGKPPKEHQFKRGQSGNPRGRPKKKPDEFYDSLASELQKLAIIESDGKQLWVTNMRAIVKKVVDKAKNGNMQSVKLILEFLKKSGGNLNFVIEE